MACSGPGTDRAEWPPGKVGRGGTRISAVHFSRDTVVAYYDGRASAAENYEERTGVATGTEPSVLTALGSAPFAEARHGQGLRYLHVLPLADGPPVTNQAAGPVPRHQPVGEVLARDRFNSLTSASNCGISAWRCSQLSGLRGRSPRWRARSSGVVTAASAGLGRTSPRQRRCAAPEIQHGGPVSAPDGP